MATGPNAIAECADSDLEEEANDIEPAEGEINPEDKALDGDEEGEDESIIVDEQAEIEADQEAEQTAVVVERTRLLVRDFITLESLLPDSDAWAYECKRRQRKRKWFLTRIVIIYILLLITHIPLVYWKSYALNEYTSLVRRLLSRPGTSKPIHPTCVVTACAVVCPKPSDARNWYTMYGVPYATLPKKHSYFAKASYPYTFKECYLAYWYAVSPEKRTFVDGKLLFEGELAVDDHSECAQMRGSDEGNLTPVGNVQACLTLSFVFPWYSKVHQPDKTGKSIPIVVFIGGNYMMQNRPRPLSGTMAAKTNVLYIAVNYRLGVFGFSDFDVQDSGANNGVRDVRIALKWVHENAHLFGGDRTRITLYGENAGATIASILYSSREYDEIRIENGS